MIRVGHSTGIGGLGIVCTGILDLGLVCTMPTMCALCILFLHYAHYAYLQPPRFCNHLNLKIIQTRMKPGLNPWTLNEVYFNQVHELSQASQGIFSDESLFQPSSAFK